MDSRNTRPAKLRGGEALGHGGRARPDLVRIGGALLSAFLRDERLQNITGRCAIARKKTGLAMDDKTALTASRRSVFKPD